MSFDKAKVKQAFSAASTTYDGVADLQRSVGRALLHTADTANLNGTLLDLGCGTGFLTAELLSLTRCGHIVALDIALPMLQTARRKLANKGHVSYVCADGECLPLREDSVDAVFSNLALQWCRDLDTVFGGLKRVLKPGGRLAVSIFGTETLKELKAAWASVDGYSHVNDFYSKEQLEAALRQAGFTNISFAAQTYLPRYESVQALMRELKQIGAHHVLAGRHKGLTGKTAMRRMMAAYPSNHADQSIAATFAIIIVTATR